MGSGESKNIIKFGGVEQTLEVVNTGGDLVNFLTGLDSECPLFGTEIKFIKKLGNGTYGSAWEIKSDKFGKKTYVAKVIEDPIEVHWIKNPISLTEVYEKTKESHLPKDLFYKLNKKENLEVGDLLFLPKISSCVPIESYERFDNQSTIKPPKNSVFCRDSLFSEYYVGLICGQIARNGNICFLDVFGFSTCPNLKEAKLVSYIFMDKITETMLSAIKAEKLDHEYLLDNYAYSELDLIVVQVLCAISYLQSHKIVHGDLHLDNVFLERITSETTFAGEKLVEHDYLTWVVDGEHINLPIGRYIAKIGDFGLAVMYGDVYVGNETTIVNGFSYSKIAEGSPIVPNWFSNSYDVLYFLLYAAYSGNTTDFITKLFSEALGVDNMDTRNPVHMQKLGERVSYYFNQNKRPNIFSVDDLNNAANPVNLLKSKTLDKFKNVVPKRTLVVAK